MTDVTPRRAALELGALAGLTGLYLGLLPRRPPGLDVALALVAVGLVAWQARAELAAPAAGGRGRDGRATRLLVGATMAVLVLFALYGAWVAFGARQRWADVLVRLGRPRFFLALALYVPWALVQQTLLQVYLLGRWRALLPAARPGGLAVLNGLAYGAVHLPEWDLALLTAIGGVAWSATYDRDRRLRPIACSHAALGAAFSYWVADRDLLAPLFD